MQDRESPDCALRNERGQSGMTIHLSAACKVLAAVGALAALASCATLNEDQCRTADWSRLGQEDGMAGRAWSHVEQHRNACARHGLPVDEQRWSAGWEQGIRAFCTPENGLIHGREGRHYANSCPADLKPGFEAAYSVAKALHDARSSRDALQRELDSLRSARERAETAEERQRLDREIDAKRSALRTAERRLWDAQGDYDLYVSRRSSRY